MLNFLQGSQKTQATEMLYNSEQPIKVFISTRSSVSCLQDTRQAWCKDTPGGLT
jgi:hypothetical protein